MTYRIYYQRYFDDFDSGNYSTTKFEEVDYLEADTVEGLRQDIDKLVNNLADQDTRSVTDNWSFRYKLGDVPKSLLEETPKLPTLLERWGVFFLTPIVQCIDYEPNEVPYHDKLNNRYEELFLANLVTLAKNKLATDQKKLDEKALVEKQKRQETYLKLKEEFESGN